MKSRNCIVLAIAIQALCVSSVWAGYNVSVNTVSDFPESFKRLAILPAVVPEGFDPLWVERSLSEKLAKRGIKAVPAAITRQALFDLGLTEATQEAIDQLSKKLEVDTFILPVVGTASSQMRGAYSTGTSSAVVTGSGGFWSGFGSGFGVTVPVERKTGSVELLFVSESGRILLKGEGYGSSDARSLKGVLGKTYDQILDRAFTPKFFERREKAQQAVEPPKNE